MENSIGVCLSEKFTISNIAQRIFVFRDVQVMMDRDWAEIYQLETRIINQVVKRNIERFPENYRFQLDNTDFENWKSQVVMSNEDKMGLCRAPFAFNVINQIMTIRNRMFKKINIVKFGLHCQPN